MEQEKETEKQKLKRLSGALETDESKKILEALEEIREEGHESLIPQLIHIWATTSDEQVRKEIFSIFYDLKDSSTLDKMIEGLDHPDIVEDRAKYISIFWNARLDASPYIKKFVEIVTEGDYMESFEALTVIENMEGPFEENSIMDSLIIVKEYLSGKSDYKKEIVESVKKRLDEINDKL